MKKYFGLRGQSLNWAVGLIAGCDFLLFGYGTFLLGSPVFEPSLAFAALFPLQSHTNNPLPSPPRP